MYILIHMHKYIHKYIHTYLPTYLPTYIHIYTIICIYIYIYMCRHVRHSIFYRTTLFNFSNAVPVVSCQQWAAGHASAILICRREEDHSFGTQLCERHGSSRGRGGCILSSLFFVSQI